MLIDVDAVILRGFTLRQKGVHMYVLYPKIKWTSVEKSLTS